MTASSGDTPNPLTQRKDALRRQLRRLRKAVAPRQARRAATSAARRLCSHPRLRRARHIAVYLSYRSELDTACLIETLLRQGKFLYVPRIKSGHRMHFVALAAGTPLRANRLGIREPTRSFRGKRAGQMDVIILPLLGFDDDGHRLGNGGGYYDRALAAQRPFRKPLRVGYGYALQRVPEIPVEPWDIRLHAVATERGVHPLR